MRVAIPPNDVPVIDPSTGRMTVAWYDALKNLEKLGLVDLADVPMAAPTTTGFKPLWDAVNKVWTWG